jgi:1,2-diacylglycerol-3-alpha-glucose alpha-1,2-galactosyltransferase
MLAEIPAHPAPTPLAFRRNTGRRLRVNIISETGMLGLTSQGGHVGFVDCAALMARHPDLDVGINRDGRCDLVHSHTWGPWHWYMGHGSRRIHTAHVIPETARGTLPFGEVGAPVFRRYLRAVYDSADVVISVSPHTTEAIEALGTRSPVVTIANPLRLDRFFPSAVLRTRGRRRLGIRAGEPLVLGVGQVQPRKGIADFCATAERVPDATFVWVGGRPFGLATAGITELNRLMRRPPPNVRFIGMVDHDEMPALHNAADAMLFPSFQENCPYAPLEAAGCGVPVVFRDLPGYRSLYQQPVLSGSDPDSFAHQVRALLERREWHDRWSAASMALARSFSTEAYVDAVANVYDAVACELGTGG